MKDSIRIFSNLEKLKKSIVFLISLITTMGFSQPNARHFPVNFIVVDDLQISSDHLEERIVNQLNIINSAFSNAGVSFSKRNVWNIYYDPSVDVLQRGDIFFLADSFYDSNQSNSELEDFINVFLITQTIECGIPGFSTFPESYGNINLGDDGLFINNQHNTIFFNTDGFFNERNTAIHEFGHFFGLFHTFRGWNLGTCGYCDNYLMDIGDCDVVNNCTGSTACKCDERCEQLVCYVSTNPLGDGIMDTKSTVPYTFLGLSYLQDDYLTGNLSGTCFSLMDEWLNDPYVVRNYMNYSLSTRDLFTSGQLAKISEVKEYPDRIKLSHCPISEELDHAFTTLGSSFVNLGFLTEQISCNGYNIKEKEENQKSAQYGIYRLQITRDLNKNFTSKAGYRDTWTSGVNAAMVVDAGVLVDNTGNISFQWDVNATPTSAIYEGPRPNTTYKATLAIPYIDQAGFSIFSEEVVFTTGDFYTDDNLCNLINIQSLSPNSGSQYNIGDQMTLSWTIINSDQSCLAEYEVQTDVLSNFATANTHQTNVPNIGFQVSGSGRIYWRVRARNTDGEWGAWSSSRYVDLIDPNSPSAICEKPQGLYVTSITNNQATVAWQDVEPTETYEVQWGKGNYNNSISAGSLDYKNLINLQADQTYQWRVRTTCANGDNSSWAYGPEFTTLRQNQFNADGDLRISGSISLSQDDQLCKGQTITIDYKAYYSGFSSENVDVQFGVFLSDDTSYDASDVLLAETFSSFGVASSISGGTDSEDFEYNIQFPFDIPQPVQNYFDMYVLVVADYNNRFVETDESNNVTYRDIIFSCDGCCDPSAHNYNPGTTEYLDVGGIPFCERYRCDTCYDGIQNGDETDIDCGGSLCDPCGTGCNVYEVLSEQSITSNSVSLQWSAGDNPNSYTIFYKKITATSYTQVFTTSNSLTLYSLTPETQYCWYVRTNCDDQQPISMERCFTTSIGVWGCTYPVSHNYDANATDDDGSCMTCNDGIQNGDETGVDCGGSLCGDCCITDLIITNAIDPVYESSQSIETLGDVPIVNSQNTEFKSQSVTLKPGMHAQRGSVFKAHVDPCNN